MHVKPITAQEKFNFPRADAILARAQALLWVRDCHCWATSQSDSWLASQSNSLSPLVGQPTSPSQLMMTNQSVDHNWLTSHAIK
jgi:hypothetical protein